MRRFNDWLALRITNAVSTMTCAYLFAGLALVSLPTAIHQGLAALVQWTAQTFLQLVLLSIIMVGQKVQSERTAQRTDQLLENQQQHHHMLAMLHRHHGIPTEKAGPDGEAS